MWQGTKGLEIVTVDCKNHKRAINYETRLRLAGNPGGRDGQGDAAGLAPGAFHADGVTIAEGWEGVGWVACRLAKRSLHMKSVTVDMSHDSTGETG